MSHEQSKTIQTSAPETIFDPGSRRFGVTRPGGSIADLVPQSGDLSQGVLDLISDRLTLTPIPRRAEPQVRTIKDLRKLSEHLKGVPESISSKVFGRMTGFNVPTAKESSLSNAVMQIYLQNLLQEPEREARRGERKARFQENVTVTRDLAEMRHQGLVIRNLQAMDNLASVLERLTPNSPQYKAAMKQYLEHARIHKQFGGVDLTGDEEEESGQPSSGQPSSGSRTAIRLSAPKGQPGSNITTLRSLLEVMGAKEFKVEEE